MIDIARKREILQCHVACKMGMLAPGTPSGLSQFWIDGPHSEDCTYGLERVAHPAPRAVKGFESLTEIALN